MQILNLKKLLLRINRRFFVEFVVSLSVVFLISIISCAYGSIFETKTFDNENTKITARKTSFDKKKSEILYFGNVQIISKFKSGERVEAFGNFAKYNTITGRGKICGKGTFVKYFYFPENSSVLVMVVIYAQEVQFDEVEEIIKAFGDVVVINSSGVIHSDNVIFSKKTSRAVFEKDKKRPNINIVYNNRKQFYESDKIIFYDKKKDARKVFMKGSVKGKIEMGDSFNGNKS
jgi:lipopolysaccharide export system protein LptA